MSQSPQPDPALGVFSTMLVVDGRPVEPDLHLSRLRESVRALYGIELPARAAGLAADEAHGLALGRVRVSCCVDDGGEPRLEAVARPVDPAVVLPDAVLDLRSMSVDGWHGAHKWVDRRLLERLDADAAPAGALLVERDGRALETTRANVFALGADGVVRTPPADGAILPGVTRASTIAIAREAGVEVREEPLELDALRVARELFATGSVRGVEPVRSLDGVPAGGGGEVASLVAEALRRRWFGRRAAGASAGSPRS
jgi:para-aminobenzoate synthetase / 4-amino-4-deoxychorismate lyase